MTNCYKFALLALESGLCSVSDLERAITEYNAPHPQKTHTRSTRKPL